MTQRCPEWGAFLDRAKDTSCRGQRRPIGRARSIGEYRAGTGDRVPFLLEREPSAKEIPFSFESNIADFLENFIVQYGRSEYLIDSLLREPDDEYWSSADSRMKEPLEHTMDSTDHLFNHPHQLGHAFSLAQCGVAIQEMKQQRCIVCPERLSSQVLVIFLHISLISSLA